MRLVSQNGIIDVPYEKVCLYIAQSEEGPFDVVARSEGATYIMARYNDREYAINQLKLLRFSRRNTKYFEFPVDVQ